MNEKVEEDRKEEELTELETDGRCKIEMKRTRMRRSARTTKRNETI